MRKLACLLILILLMMPMSYAEEGIATDLSGDFLTATLAPEEPDVPDFSEAIYEEQHVATLNAEVVIGYAAQNGAILNPFSCNESDLVALNQLVFEPLVTLNAEQKPSPMLADNWTREDKAWTFTLRSGVSFHNGAALTAYDVVATYQRFLTASPETNPYTSRLELYIESMEALSDTLLLVNAKYTGIMTLYAMTFPIVQSGTLEDGLARGTGPYWYTEYLPDDYVILEANPLWWQKTPTIPSIAFRRYTETADEIIGLQTGAVDMFSTTSTKASLCRRMSSMTYKDYATMTYEIMLPNLGSTSNMSNQAVRRAVMYALDRALIATNAYMDMAIQSEVPVLPASWLYESQSAQYYYSPERALKILYDDGWQDLTGDTVLNKLDGIQMQELRIDLVTYNEETNSNRSNAADMIAEFLRKVGFKVNVIVVSKTSMENRLQHRNFDLALIGVNLSEIPALQPLLGTGGAINYNHISNNEIDTLLEDSLNATTEDELRQIYSQLEMKIVDRLPIMGLLFHSGMVLSTRSLGGLREMRQLHPFNGMQYLDGSD